MSNQHKTDFQLRSDAEKKIALNPPIDTGLYSVRGLLHELEVQKIELEMQNLQLLETLEELTASRKQFADLYEFAPCAYLTLRADGSISKINNAGTSLLGMDRSLLIDRRFAIFISEHDRKQWAQYFTQSMQIGGPNSIGVALALDDRTIDVEVRSVTHAAGADSTEMHLILTDVGGVK